MIRLIAAIDNQRGIAKQGRLPWDLPADRHYFAEQTKRYGGRILMGQRTFATIGHPLSDRHNYVASRQADSVKGVTYVTQLEAFMRQQTEDLWVIGGALIYEQTLQWADELYLTEIAADLDCDLFFPAFIHAFDLAQKSPQHSENGLVFTYNIYKRKKRR